MLEVNHTCQIIYNSMENRTERGLSKSSSRKKAGSECCVDKTTLASTNNVISSLYIT